MSPPAPTRPRAGRGRALPWVVLVTAAASACSLSQNGVDPPADTFFYPSTGAMLPAPAAGGLAPTDPAFDWLYVGNSNADLRFNDGTLVMVNVGTRQDAGTMSGAAFDRTQSWGQCPQEDYVNPLPRSDAPICCRDLLDANIINCDERRYIAADATVLIGSFAAGMAWQAYCDDPCLSSKADCLAAPAAGRLLIGVRGDTSLTDVDVAPTGSVNGAAVHPGFHCTDDDEVAPALTECTRKQTDTLSNLDAFAQSTSVPVLALPDEPYALTVDGARGFLYIGHLAGTTSVQDTGGVSLFDASGAGLYATGFPPVPAFIAPFPSPFAPNNAGQFGITNLHLHEPLGVAPGSPTELFVSSRYVPLVTSMVPFGPPLCGQDTDLKDDVVIPSGDSLSSGSTLGSEMRGVSFVEPTAAEAADPDLDFANRVYALERVPPELVGFDVARNESGAVVATPTDVTETCSSPTFLYETPDGQVTADNPRRLFVNCFDTGEVYVFDPNGPTLLTTLQVGRGPGGMVFDPVRPVAYVLNFTLSDVSVVDLAPGSPTQFHVVQRLGFPSVTPR